MQDPQWENGRTLRHLRRRCQQRGVRKVDLQALLDWADRVVAVDGKPAVRPMMIVTISCDHRVADGAKAALFLNELAQALAEPAKWLG